MSDEYPNVLMLVLPEPIGGGYALERRWGNIVATKAGSQTQQSAFPYHGAYEQMIWAIQSVLQDADSSPLKLIRIIPPTKTLTIALHYPPPHRARRTGVMLLQAEAALSTVYFDYQSLRELVDPLQTLWKKLYQEQEKE